jgi:internalin A
MKRTRAVVAVACLFSAVAVPRARGIEPAQVAKRIQDAGGKVSYDNPQHEKNIYGIQLAGKRLDDELINCIASIPNLLALDLSDTTLTDEQFAKLNIANLRTLALNNTKISDESLKRLSNCHGLEELGLAGTQISEAGIAYLWQLDQLEKLDLRDLPLGPHMFEWIGFQSDLRQLGINDSKLGPEGQEVMIAKLGVLKELQSFGAGRTPLSPAVYAWLRTLPSLNQLAIEGVHLTRNDLEGIGAISGLQHLNLDNDIFESGLRPLSALVKLKTLHMVSSTFDSDELKWVAGLPELSTLWLAKSPGLSDVGMAHIGKCTHLREFGAEGTQITDAGLAHLANLADLKVILAPGCRISDKGVWSLRELKSIEFIDLSNTDVTDGCMESFGKLPTLMALALDATKITNAGLANLTHLKQLGVLSISDTAVTDDGLKTLAAIPTLRVLHLDNTKLTNEGAFSAIDKMADLVILSVKGTGLSEDSLVPPHCAAKSFSQSRQLKLHRRDSRALRAASVDDAKQLP